MGTFYYGGGHGDLPAGFDLDDVLLAHLKLVIIAKLRLGESFIITVPALEHGCQVREALWVNPSIPMRFVMDQPDGPLLDHHRLESLMIQANTLGGIVLQAESTNRSLVSPSEHRAEKN
jgi:hypothetical protein